MKSMFKKITKKFSPEQTAQPQTTPTPAAPPTKTATTSNTNTAANTAAVSKPATVSAVSAASTAPRSSASASPPAAAMSAKSKSAADTDDDDVPVIHDLSRSQLLKPIPSLLDNSATAAAAPTANVSPSSPPSPSSSARIQLFIHKLRLCSITFDWSKEKAAALAAAQAGAAAGEGGSAAAAAANQQAALAATGGIDLTTTDGKMKDAKRAQLLDVLDFIGRTKGIYSDAVLVELISMVRLNLFRSLPPRHSDSPTGDEDEPVYEPAWIHLQIVYELFLRFIVSTDVDVRTLKKYINSTFVLHLLTLFDSEDHRERDYLKTILHRIYAKFMSLRAFIRKAINHVFFTFIYDSERHNGVAELLEILGSIINGFALPLKPEHKQFLKKVLVPMHKVKGLVAFHQQLSYCVSQFVDKEPELAVPVLLGLLQYWPLTNSSKEVLFLNELEELLELTQNEEFSQVITPLFRQIGRCIVSPHFQVAERVLFLWHNDYISHLIAQHRAEILPLLKGVVFASDNAHWNGTVNNLTVNVWKIFVDLDGPLVEKCVSERRSLDERRLADRAPRLATWQRITDCERAWRIAQISSAAPSSSHYRSRTHVKAPTAVLSAALVNEEEKVSIVPPPYNNNIILAVNEQTNKQSVTASS